jgi:hypothetical protein
MELEISALKRYTYTLGCCVGTFRRRIFRPVGGVESFLRNVYTIEYTCVRVFFFFFLWLLFGTFSCLAFSSKSVHVHLDGRLFWYLYMCRDSTVSAYNIPYRQMIRIIRTCAFVFISCLCISSASPPFVDRLFWLQILCSRKKLKNKKKKLRLLGIDIFGLFGFCRRTLVVVAAVYRHSGCDFNKQAQHTDRPGRLFLRGCFAVDIDGRPSICIQRHLLAPLIETSEHST